MLDRSSSDANNKSSRARIPRTIRRLCELDLVHDVQIVQSLMENGLQSHVFVRVMIPVALYCAAIVILVVPDLSLITQAHDRSDEVDCVLLELLRCHKITFQQ